MKIDAIDVFHVEMPLVRPFRTAFGEETVVESVLVRMRCGAASGWGEASPLAAPAYSGEYAGGAFGVIIRFLAPLLLGQDIPSGAELQRRLAAFKANPFAKAALDHAWWDLDARIRRQPLWKTIGGRRDTVDVGADFGILAGIDELIRMVQAALEAGFKRIKLKYGPGWELEMVAAVRQAFPDATIHIDCNSAYTLDHLDMFKKLDEYDLAMIEQPLGHDDLIDHAALQRRIRTPICLDESITSPPKARKAIEIGACRWINVKPGRVGGLTHAVAIHDLCRDAQVPCWVGGMLESAVGGYHCLALATLENFKYPSDIFPSERFYEPDLAEPPILLSGPSQVTALPGAGCGAEPVQERLESQTIQKASLRP